MLRRLAIRDFVIVDRLELDFAGGFGTLTGETGAGKSILLDALSLALGGRADAGVVRSGQSRAEITAEFDLPAGSPLAAWLDEQELSSEDGSVLLRRVVDANGRSRAWLNGSPVVLAQLREAGEWLADIHGQHAHHALLRGDAQQALLDAHAGLTEQAAQVATRYRTLAAARRARESAETQAAASERERELMEWQCKELRDLDFDPAEWETLNQEQARLAHAASLLEGADEALGTLADGDQPIGPQLDRLVSRLAALTEYDGGLKDAQELLSSAAIQLDEALHALRRYRDRLDLDPQRLAEADRRIEAVTGLARKYRVTPDELPELLATSEARLAQLDRLSNPAALAEEEAAAQAAYLAAAGELSQRRAPAARGLSDAVTAAMQDLAMAGAQFEVVLVPVDGGNAGGLESVEFRVTANASQPLRPLAKVASGGELSRIGLAIQVITSRNAVTPTLVFDEVDVGIGGRVAEIVGRMLKRLGQERQVLCVTHLPQVAAQADWQWSIAKETRDGETLSSVTALDEQGRVEEIARMLGGVNITDTTRSHAAEMLGLDGLQSS